MFELLLFLFVVNKPARELEVDEQYRKIRCPKCRWQPTSSSRWYCSPGCKHCWNTFDTHAKCPNCGRKWTYTQCLVCDQHSLHEDWYEKGQDHHLVLPLNFCNSFCFKFGVIYESNLQYTDVLYISKLFTLQYIPRLTFEGFADCREGRETKGLVYK